MSAAPPRGREVLLTGTTGFLGKVLLRQLLEQADALGIARIHALVRPASPAAEARFARSLRRAACFHGLRPELLRRLQVLPGDLSLPHCGIAPAQREELRARATHVIHAAAAVAFDLPLGEAAQANVATALEVLELARSMHRLESLLHISTAYVTPHPGAGVAIKEAPAPLPESAELLWQRIRNGRAAERALLAASKHPNTYTFSKCLAEQLLLARGRELPLRILRPSIISASFRHPAPGWIDSAAAFAAFVALIGLGRLRAVVAHPKARLDLIPVDWVAGRILHAMSLPAEAPAPLLHITAGPRNSPSIEECRDRILAFFRAHPTERRPAIRYLGPPGLRFAAAHRLHHELPLRLRGLRSPPARRRARLLLGQLEQLNRAFPYFTQRTFHFESSMPLDLPGFDPREYVSTVSRGVSRHILRR